jgi:glutamate synthase (NADPH/NADH) small chain
MIYGIPGFKLEKDIVLRRWRSFEEAGIVFHLDTEIGRDVSLEDLRARHDAILIGTGVYKPRDISVPGTDLPGVVPALDYLTASNRVGLGDAVEKFASGALDARGRHVVVVGGGDTAMDCVRTAVRQGAASVKCLYRRDQANMPGSMREVANAMEEGVEFVWLSAPDAFLGDAHVTGVRVTRMRLGLPDATGRQTVEEVPDSAYTIRADLVLKALGFDPEDLPRLWNVPGLEVSRWGTIRADHRSFMTSLPGVFAAGDIVRGASLVVWAIRDGRDAAERMHAYVQQNASALAVAAE